MAGKNGIPLSHSDRTSIVTLWVVCPVSRPYVRSEVFKENLIFSPLSAYSPTPRAIKSSLRPLNSDYNLLQHNNVKLTKR